MTTPPISDLTRLSQRRRRQGFTLLEVLVSMTILSIIVLTLSQLMEVITDVWDKSEKRIESYQGGRGTLEIITRELTPAVVDTRMQFAIIEAEDLLALGVPNICAGQTMPGQTDPQPDSNAILWMAPLGQDGALSCVGYYLTRDEAKGFYRLKRLYIPSFRPDQPDVVHPYFPSMVAMDGLRAGGVSSSSGLVTLNHSQELSTTPIDASWFWRSNSLGKTAWDAALFDEMLPTSDPNYPLMSVSTAGDHVVAFWIQAIDTLGNPIPWMKDRFTPSQAPNHPPGDTVYNSAALMHFANTTPFDGGNTVAFLSGPTATPQQHGLKANRVPAAVDITVVTLSARALAKGFPVPVFPHIMTNGVGGYGNILDVETSLQTFNDDLLSAGHDSARTFTTRVKLLNGS